MANTTLSSSYDEYLSHSYQEKINLSKKNCTVLKHELENYSTFDSKLIGSIIEKLVTLVEGKEYVYQEAIHKTYELESTILGGQVDKVEKKTLMIVEGSQKRRYYNDYHGQDNEVNRLVQNGQAFILSEHKLWFSSWITFYTMYKENLKCLIDFGKFSYVQDFIDLVVEYRFKNNLSKVSEKDLLSLMSGFVLNNKVFIEENYKKKNLENQEQVIKQLIK